MNVSDEVESIIFEAIDEANEVRPKHEWLKKDRATPLVGPESGLDSLGVLNLVLAVESRVNARFDAALDLSGLLAADDPTTALRSVTALAEYVAARLGGVA